MGCSNSKQGSAKELTAAVAAAGVAAVSGKKWQIFCLGTNNWQGGGEFAPGSGILHEGHHESFQALPNVSGCYSMWPSKTQRTKEDRKDYRVFALSHDIPICESISPVSSYRWHSMSQEEFDNYRNRLIREVEEYIQTVEEETKTPFNLFIAHHCFVNPTVMVEINQRRVAAGKNRVPVVVFAHGTALKMFQNELKNLADYPSRFYPWIQGLNIFSGDSGAVDGVFVIAKAQQEIFLSLFSTFPSQKVIIAPNGYNQKIFHKVEGATPSNVLPSFPAKYYDGLADEVTPHAAQVIAKVEASGIPADQFQRWVLFTGKFADWKRIDVILKAAKLYRKAAFDSGVSIGTLIVGGGPQEDEIKYKKLAYVELGEQEHVFFLGPLGQDALTKINTIVNIGVFPSKDEPFGLVFIECMACGTPVLGAKSGGPVDFVVPEVGALIDESDDHDLLAQRFADAVVEATVTHNWKSSKGPKCIEYAMANFSLNAQCAQMLDSVDTSFLKASKL